MDQDKLVHWLNMHISSRAGDNWWDDDWNGGYLAALKEVRELVNENYFAPIEGVVND